MNKSAMEYLVNKMKKETDAELERRYGKPPSDKISVNDFAEVLKRAKPINSLIADRMISAKSVEVYHWSDVINKVPEIVAVVRERHAALAHWNLNTKRFLDSACAVRQKITDRAHLEPRANGISLLIEFVQQIKSITK